MLSAFALFHHVHLERVRHPQVVNVEVPGLHKVFHETPAAVLEAEGLASAGLSVLICVNDNRATYSPLILAPGE